MTCAHSHRIPATVPHPIPLADVNEQSTAYYKYNIYIQVFS